MVRVLGPLFVASAQAFAPSNVLPARRGVAVSGIFDGVKDAFSQDVSIVEDDRITPFDRWLGIDVRSEESKKAQFAVPDDFVDSMDESNYVIAHLPKPMGIVFEENDPSDGGVFVASLANDGAAAKDATLQAGDQLVAVGDTCLKGSDFDGCLDAIAKSTADRTKLIFFRGGPSNLYGNLGASDEWMQEFMEAQRKSP